MGEETRVRTRAATVEDVPEMAAVLARAFDDDPLMRWILPRPARLETAFAVLARHTHPIHEGSELAWRNCGVEAAALWDPPERWRLPVATQIRRGPQFLRAFGRRLPAAMRVLNAMERHHPAEPHWYLHIIGTDPAAQGHGLGGALLASRLEKCDAEGLPAYLESSNPVNVPLYERFGFTVTRELAMPGSCPPIHLMWRDPR